MGLEFSCGGGPMVSRWWGVNVKLVVWMGLVRSSTVELSTQHINVVCYWEDFCLRVYVVSRGGLCGCG